VASTSEKLAKRIQLIEEKLIPKPKGTFDVIRHIQVIRNEAERLMQLSESEYEKEIQIPPHSKVNQVARIGVANKKRFDSLSLEDQRRELGYPNLDALEFAKIQEAQALIKTSPNNWVTDLFRKREASRIQPSNPA
jgi:hypothetical protein